MVRTSDSHSGNRGSIPLGPTIVKAYSSLRINLRYAPVSSPAYVCFYSFPNRACILINKKTLHYVTCFIINKSFTTIIHLRYATINYFRYGTCRSLFYKKYCSPLDFVTHYRSLQNQGFRSHFLGTPFFLVG